ncbi:MAG: hypothetical protein WDZ83_14125 [Rhizobiaceae bacterium]
MDDRFFDSETWNTDAIIFALVFIVISLLLSEVIRYFRRKTKTIVWSSEEYWILNPEARSSDVLVKFGDIDLNYATLSHIFFWNAGNTTLLGNDVAKRAPITLALSSGRLVSAKIVSESDQSCEARLSTDDTSFSIAFDYLEPNEGLKIEVIASDLSAGHKPAFIKSIKNSTFEQKGKLIGNSLGLRYVTATKSQTYIFYKFLILPALILFLLLWFVVGVAGIYSYFFGGYNIFDLAPIAGLIALILFAIVQTRIMGGIELDDAPIFYIPREIQ